MARKATSMLGGLVTMTRRLLTVFPLAVSRLRFAPLCGSVVFRACATLAEKRRGTMEKRRALLAALAASGLSLPAAIRLALAQGTQQPDPAATPAAAPASSQAAA